MIKFDKPANLNGAELLAELKTAKIDVNGLPTIDANNDLWLDVLIVLGLQLMKWLSF